MKDSHLSQRDGKHSNFLAEKKVRSKSSYDLIKEFGGIHNYIDECIRLKNELLKIHQAVSNNGSLTFVDIHRSSEQMRKQYSSPQSFATAITNMAYSVTHKSPTARVYHNMVNIVDAFTDYLDSHISELTKLRNELKQKEIK